jgi:hypothetical protein
MNVQLAIQLLNTPAIFQGMIHIDLGNLCAVMDTDALLAHVL